ncbi:hypothetical protein K2173_016839 [Erythroxylum novogranatense]|uniref:Transcription repressor n=1 Tax=Erythroxylum novogranatense TaxID=1862640 RepID=A0AAV8SI12_9ROSI|nr:hypothetical protein K2173_016839 [Erythroxylum novogranatense]
MGNYSFRLSDMIPNAWFYKLKDMSKSRKQYTSRRWKKKVPSSSATSRKSNVSWRRYSYYSKTAPNKVDKRYNFPVNLKVSDTHLPEQPRASSNRRSERKTIYRPSPKLVSSSFTSSSYSSHAANNSVWTGSVPDDSVGYWSSSSFGGSPELNFNESLLSESEEDDNFVVTGLFDRQVALWSTYRNCKFSSSKTDVIIDMNDECRETKVKSIDGHDTMISEPELHRCATRPAKFEDKEIDATNTRKRSSKAKKVSLCQGCQGGKRQDAYREKYQSISNRKIQASAQKSVSSSRNKTLSKSFALVKSSADPQRDFRDSMVEMIVENNIRESKDLEDLLTCYLSLNSNENHDLIVKVFEEVWVNMTDQLWKS